jgi:hypothetical protein
MCFVSLSLSVDVMKPNPTYCNKVAYQPNYDVVKGVAKGTHGCQLSFNNCQLFDTHHNETLRKTLWFVIIQTLK